MVRSMLQQMIVVCGFLSCLQVATVAKAYYASHQGRFISRDPIGYEGGNNLYAGYFIPNGVDPNGHQARHLPNPGPSSPSPSYPRLAPGTCPQPTPYGPYSGNPVLNFPGNTSSSPGPFWNPYSYTPQIYRPDPNSSTCLIFDPVNNTVSTGICFDIGGSIPNQSPTLDPNRARMAPTVQPMNAREEKIVRDCQDLHDFYKLVEEMGASCNKGMSCYEIIAAQNWIMTALNSRQRYMDLKCDRFWPNLKDHFSSLNQKRAGLKNCDSLYDLKDCSKYDQAACICGANK